MDPQEQRIAIAEACGWTNIHLGNVWLSDPPLPEILVGRHPGYKMLQAVPRYLNDLNAMHEAEKHLVEKGVNTWWTYAGHLLRDNPTPLGKETAINATATQRAEAFLKTLNLWKQ